MGCRIKWRDLVQYKIVTEKSVKTKDVEHSKESENIQSSLLCPYSKLQALRPNLMNIDEPVGTSRKSGKSTHLTWRR